MKLSDPFMKFTLPLHKSSTIIFWFKYKQCGYPKIALVEAVIVPIN